MFGIRPWEWDDMSAREVLMLVGYIDDRNREAAKK